MNKEIMSITRNHPDGIQEWVEEDLLPHIADTIKCFKEDENDEPSKNEDLGVEEMYDYIAGQLLGRKGNDELRKAIRLFGKKRYNQGINDIKKLLENK